MKTICVTALSVMLVTAFCGGAFGAEYCRPTGELQEKAQALADLAVKEGLQGACSAASSGAAALMMRRLESMSSGKGRLFAFCCVFCR